ncbi:TolC family protein [Pedobacter sp. KLB.chiD]|uniref:TolC family protein n=1 Tax=Pedobacter sp. KLB.chiD TaxID=3387402 RepID=UPI00399ACABB
MIRIFSWLILFWALTIRAAFAQSDTLSLNLSQAKSLFLKNNFDLLASNYEIDLAKAEIITAKLFENPTLEYENLFYNKDTRKFLQTSYAHGQYAGSISQLFKLAGKRNKNIKLAQTGVKMAEYEYFDLIRTLKFELENTFYKTYFAAQSVKVYQEQISSTDQLASAYHLQLKMGNVAAKDVIRIKSLSINLKAEQAELLNDLEDYYKDLKLFCGISASTSITLVLDQSVLNSPAVDKIPYQALLDSARLNRADLKLAKTNLLYHEHNLKLQKAQAIPDIEMGMSYDLKGNYPEKYTGLGIKIPIPLFSRNQGEIKKAQIGITAAAVNIKKQEAILEHEVFNSYKTALRNEKLCAGIDPALSTDFNILVSGLIKNFKARNVSLIEFLDLYDAYKENTLQLNKLQSERMSTRAELNYVTGSNIFK